MQNQDGGVLLISEVYPLVSANKAPTCDRPRANRDLARQW